MSVILQRDFFFETVEMPEPDFDVVDVAPVPGLAPLPDGPHRCPECREAVGANPLRSQGIEYHPGCYLELRARERLARDGRARILPFIASPA